MMDWFEPRDAWFALLIGASIGLIVAVFEAGRLAGARRRRGRHEPDPAYYVPPKKVDRRVNGPVVLMVLVAGALAIGAGFSVVWVFDWIST